LSHPRIITLVSLAMLAFAGNSILCRVALSDTGIDAASFTTVRLVSGAVMLWLVVRIRFGRHGGGGNWPSALALFVYAAGFSFAYMSLSAATGALLLFGAVQATMIGYGIWAGERLQGLQLSGLVLAFSGFVGLLLPGLSAPPLYGSLLMLVAGMAWGVYSLRGKGTGDPTTVTAGNFFTRRSRGCRPEPVHESRAFTGLCRTGVCGRLGRAGFGNRLRHLVHGTTGAAGNQCSIRAAQCSGHRGTGRHATPG
jgi:drug/metabolite transporter (DMT)-like permease